jgi:hypothetical protein
MNVSVGIIAILMPIAPILWGHIIAHVKRDLMGMGLAVLILMNASLQQPVNALAEQTVKTPQDLFLAHV